MKKKFLNLLKKALPKLKNIIPTIFHTLRKVLSLKTLLVVGVVVAIVAILYLGIGGGIGGGKGEGEGAGTIETSQNSQEDTTEEKTEYNGDEYEGAIFDVTVAGNDYFFKNERIELEKLLDSFDDVKGPFVVEIKDDNASLKAYKALTDRLDNLYIRYIEK